MYGIARTCYKSTCGDNNLQYYRRGEYNPEAVGGRLGHASVTITMDIYSRALPGIQRDAAEKISTGLSDSRRGLSAVLRYHMFTVKLAGQHLRTVEMGSAEGQSPSPGSVRACPESIEGVPLTNKDVSRGWVGNVNVCRGIKHLARAEPAEVAER